MSGSPKIKTLQELQAVIEAARQAGRRVVQCHGVFDLLHPGHILHFQAARRHGDVLVVTVTPDSFVHKGPGRPVFNQRLRLETLAALEDVDYVALNEWPTAAETIRRLHPHVYVKGQDYANPADDVSGNIVEEEAAVREGGGTIVFTQEEAFSSSHLLNQFFSAYPEPTQAYLQALRQRYSSDQVLERLRELAPLRVLVVGEAILDQYCYCIPLGKSPKETIVATRFASEEQFAGGSLAIANHLAGFCGTVTLVTVLGGDPAQEAFVRSKLHPNVRLETVGAPARPTITKRRYLEPNFLTKMFEVQYLNDTPIPEEMEAAVVERLTRELSGHDLLLVADFGHGMMTDRLREFIASRDIFIALNTQSNSANLGFNPVTKYPRASFACVDEPEMHLAVGRRYGDLAGMAEEVRQRLRSSRVLVSRGRLGSVIVSEDAPPQETPALATKVVDRTGAGDALFSIAAPCVYRGFPSELVGFIGNCMGALAVEIVGNREPVSPTHLYKFMTSVLR